MTQDDAEFERLLAEFGPALRRLAASYEPNPGRRDDLVQEIAFALWRALPRFRRECSIRTFVFRVAHNRAMTHVWRRGRAPALDMSEAEHVRDPAESPESQTVRRQQRARLDAAIRGLPMVHHQVLMLALEDLSGAEIGAVLGISESAAAVRLTRARRALGSTWGLREALGSIVMTMRDAELESWRALWTGEEVPALDVRLVVARGRRRLVRRLMLDIVVAVAWTAVAIALFRLRPDPALMALGAGIIAFVAVAFGFSIWNTAGVWEPTGASVRDFILLALERCRRDLRAVRFGLWFTAIEDSRLWCLPRSSAGCCSGATVRVPSSWLSRRYCPRSTRNKT